MLIPQKYFPNYTFYLQANSLAIGILVGIVITIMQFFFYGFSIQILVGIIIFSIVHAFAMAYAISFYTERLNRLIVYKWIKVPALFTSGVLATTLATELSYFIYGKIYQVPYVPFSHGNQTMINFSICIIVSAIVLLYESQRITYQNQFQRKEIEILRIKQLKIKEELEALQSRINPHFLYNSLNTIASLVYDQAPLAEDMTLKLSKLFRYSINYAQQNFVTISEEVEMISAYLEIERIRIGDRLSFNINVSPELKKAVIPRFLLQPLVENAIKHGLMNSSGDGEVEIRIWKKKEQCIIDVYDNGQAFPQQVLSGRGYQSTYEKLELLFPKHSYEFKLINEPHKHLHLVMPYKTDIKKE